MINLLPSQYKQELKREEGWKLILILEILILIFLICLTLILFSVKISISGQLEAQKILLGQEEKKFNESQIQNLEDKIITSSRTFVQLNSFYQSQAGLTEILEKISETLPSSVYLTTLNFNLLTGSEEEKYLAQIYLLGYSPTREILLEFKKNLEKEQTFGEIYFPSSNWVRPADIDFSVNFKIIK
jgi:Tfp pilus assembly protein PilN